jgi:hypothetical protein
MTLTLARPDLLRGANLVAGRWIAGGPDGIAVTNPATGQTLAHVPRLGRAEAADAIAAAQLSDVEVDGVPMRAAKMAELVVAGTERFGWFTDTPTLEPEHAPPLAEDAVAQLRAARRTLGADLVYVGHALPAADTCPTPARIAELHGGLVRLRALDEQARAAGTSALRRDDAATLASARALHGRLAPLCRRRQCRRQPQRQRGRRSAGPLWHAPHYCRRAVHAGCAGARGQRSFSGFRARRQHRLLPCKAQRTCALTVSFPLR